MYFNINGKNIKVLTGFSAIVVRDMLGDEGYMEFYDKYYEQLKIRRKRRKDKSRPNIGDEYLRLVSLVK